MFINFSLCIILASWNTSELISMYHWGLLCGVSLHLSSQSVFESVNVIVNFLSHILTRKA